MSAETKVFSGSWGSLQGKVLFSSLVTLSIERVRLKSLSCSVPFTGSDGYQSDDDSLSVSLTVEYHSKHKTQGREGRWSCSSSLASTSQKMVA